MHYGPGRQTLHYPAGYQAQYREHGAQKREPVAVPGEDGLRGLVVETGVRGGFGVERESATQAACGIDGCGDAVVGSPQNPTAVFGGPHANDREVLPPRGALSEPAIVRKIE